MAAVATQEFYTLEETAARFRKTARWLREWLRRRPTDRYGEPFYTLLGRTKLFDESDVARIRATAREEERCRLNFTHRDRVKRPTGRSEVHTSESMWTEAQKLLSDPLPKKCSANGKPKSSKERLAYLEW